MFCFMTADPWDHYLGRILVVFQNSMFGGSEERYCGSSFLLQRSKYVGDPIEDCNIENRYT